MSDSRLHHAQVTYEQYLKYAQQCRDAGMSKKALDWEEEASKALQFISMLKLVEQVSNKWKGSS